MENVEYQLDRRPIDEWLKSHGMNSRERLAAQLGSSGSWLDRIRREKVLPTGKKLAALADAVGVPVGSLILRVPKKPKRSA